MLGLIWRHIKSKPTGEVGYTYSKIAKDVPKRDALRGEARMPGLAAQRASRISAVRVPAGAAAGLDLSGKGVYAQGVCRS